MVVFQHVSLSGSIVEPCSSAAQPSPAGPFLPSPGWSRWCQGHPSRELLFPGETVLLGFLLQASCPAPSRQPQCPLAGDLLCGSPLSSPSPPGLIPGSSLPSVQPPLRQAWAPLQAFIWACLLGPSSLGLSCPRFAVLSNPPA